MTVKHLHAILIIGTALVAFGCVAHRPTSVSYGGQGSQRAFTNADVTMWIPSNAAQVWDGHTSGVNIGETTPPGAFVKDYKITLEIQINDTDRELQQLSSWASDWYFQEHPELSIRTTQYGAQLRKDIWNPKRTRRLLINGMVKQSGTFQADMATARKMIESIQQAK